MIIACAERAHERTCMNVSGTHLLWSAGGLMGMMACGSCLACPYRGCAAKVGYERLVDVQARSADIKLFLLSEMVEILDHLVMA